MIHWFLNLKDNQQLQKENKALGKFIAALMAQREKELREKRDLENTVHDLLREHQRCQHLGNIYPLSYLEEVVPNRRPNDN